MIAAAESQLTALGTRLSAATDALERQRETDIAALAQDRSRVARGIAAVEGLSQVLAEERAAASEREKHARELGNLARDAAMAEFEVATA